VHVYSLTNTGLDSSLHALSATHAVERMWFYDEVEYVTMNA